VSRAGRARAGSVCARAGADAAPETPILQVAVPAPLRRSFDYRAPPDAVAGGLLPGVRVAVPFGRSRRVGVVLGQRSRSDVPAARLRTVCAVLDARPAVPADLMRLLEWAADYYHHPIGEVLRSALPAALRRIGGASGTRGAHVLRLTDAGRDTDPASLARAPRQAAAVRLLRDHPGGISPADLRALLGDCRSALDALRAKGWVERVEPLPAGNAGAPPAPTAATLEPAQARVVETVDAASGGFAAFLLDGVTGSGKTEVYLELIRRAAGRGGQVLVLVPEIGLTPQMVARFGRLGLPLAVLHSGLGEGERLDAWMRARDGSASVVVGTRSAVLAPLARLALVVVDEEHDLSFKQQEGFRYSARDLAVVRAHMAEVPVLLGSATPSLESLHNCGYGADGEGTEGDGGEHGREGRYQRLTLPRRARGAGTPAIAVIDLRARPFEEGLSRELVDALEENLEQREQSLLFLNRRGYAPVCICHGCGHVEECARCDARLVYHREDGRLRCHHCGAEHGSPAVCSACGGRDVRVLGFGTQRVADALAARLPGARIARVDRDSTRRKGALAGILEAVHRGETDVLIGTQMLSKGHDFPGVTLVGILDADGGLFGADFRAAERMAQLLVQVAGRAGRAARPGRVLIQTHHPDHPLLQGLLRHGYARFARAALAERRAAGLPPCASLALLRAEAPRREATLAFLIEAARAARPHLAPGARVLGPAPAPMERRAGRHRAQLLLEAPRRAALQRTLGRWVETLETLRTAGRVRWSLDVDPQEMI